MAKQKKKSVHLHMNLGTLIFLIIVIYLMAYILSYLGKSKLAIYEVSASDIVDSIDGTGVFFEKKLWCIQNKVDILIIMFRKVQWFVKMVQSIR